MAKKPQLTPTQTGLSVNAATVNGTAVKVSGIGPLTVAAQHSITGFSTAVSATAQLQGSIDGTNYFNVGASVSVAAVSELVSVDTAPAYAWYRVQYARASGSFVVTTRWLVYGDTI